MMHIVRVGARHGLAVLALVAVLVVSTTHLYAQDEPDAIPAELTEVPAAADVSPVTSGAVADTAVPFLQNEGQVADPSILYYANTFSGSVGVTATGIQYAVPFSAAAQDPGGSFQYNPDVPPGTVYKDEAGNLKTSFKLPDSVVVVSESFLHGQVTTPNAQEPSDAQVSSFKGADQSQWRSNLPAFKTVTAGEVWPGVRVTYRATGSNVEKIFTVSAHADPSAIQLRVTGGNASVNEQGQLVIATSAGPIAFTAPVAFQEIEGVRTTVRVAYQLLSDSTYAFSLGDFNPDYPLVIDPLLAGTYVGGTSSDELTEMIVAPSGDVYISGYSLNSSFPVTSGAYSTSYRGGVTDMYIARLSADLSTLKAATYIGGSAIEGTITSMALDSGGNVIASTTVTSTDFPVTVGAYDTTANGGNDTALFKMSPDLSTLLASTYLGTSGNDSNVGLLVASDDTIYRGITAGATGMETNGGSYDATWNGGEDIYIIHLSSDLTTFLAGTYLGGTANDHSTGNHALAFDGSGNIVVVGGTASAAFPTTAGVYDTSHNGNYDIFVSRLSADLGTLLASTFVGGSGDDDYYPYETIVRASDGSYYITSISGSANFPVTDGSSLSGAGDTVVFHLSADFTSISAARYIGGAGNELNYGISLASDGYVYLTGYTFSAGFPTTAGAYQTVHGGGYDGYVTRLSPSLATVASTFVGSAGSDAMVRTRALSADRVLVGGYAAGLPTSLPAGGYDSSFNGAAFDAVVLLFTSNLSRNDPPSVVVSSAVQSPGTQRVAVRMTVSDIEKAETSASVEYSLDGIAWSPAAVSEAYEQGGYVSIAGNSISSIDTTTTGSTEVVFWWDAGVDIPHTTDESVYIRITPSDPLVAGTTVTSPSFALNTQTSAGAVALAPAGGGGGGVVVAPAPTLPTLAVSPNSNATPVITTPVAAGATAPVLFGVAVGGGSPASGAGGVVLLVRYQDSSPLVQVLQQLLNSTVVPVASVGAGSTGKETSYFGPRTLQSLRAFKARTLPQYASPFGPDAVDTYLWNALVAL